MSEPEYRRGRAMSKALAYAILTIERLPELLQEWSDKEDMRRLFEELVPKAEQRQFLFDQALMHITGKPQGIIRESYERYYAQHPEERPPDETVVEFPR